MLVKKYVLKENICESISWLFVKVFFVDFHKMKKYVFSVKKIIFGLKNGFEIKFFFLKTIKQT